MSEDTYKNGMFARDWPGLQSLSASEDGDNEEFPFRVGPYYSSGVRKSQRTLLQRCLHTQTHFDINLHSNKKNQL